MHNGHNVAKDFLENTIFGDFDTGVDLTNFNGPYINNAEKLLVVDIKLLLNKYSVTTVIMAGDFNDHGNYNYWKEMDLFKHSNINIIKNTVVKTLTQPPYTCCDVSRTWNNKDNMFGDYILVSSTYDINLKIPKNFNYDAQQFPTSDHLPIEAVLTPKNNNVNVNNVPVNVNINNVPVNVNNVPVNVNPNTRYIIPWVKKVFMLSGEKILRMKNNIADPQSTNILGFAGSTARKDTEFIYPNNETIQGDDNNMYLLVSDVTNEGAVGYINTKNIIHHPILGNVLPKTPTNLLKSIPIRGLQPVISVFKVTDKSILDVNTGRGNLTNQGLVLVRQIDDPNIYGYVRFEYLLIKNQQGGNKYKYISSKNDYLKLLLF